MNGTLRQILVGITVCGVIGGCFALGRSQRGRIPAVVSPASAALLPARSRLFARAGNTLGSSTHPAEKDPPAEPADVFDEALQRIQHDFVLSSVESHTLSEAMLSRLLAGLDDPATRAFTFAQNRVRRSQLMGYYEGIGANFAIAFSKQGEISRPVLTVQSVVAGSPAEAAELKSGDRILEIDGRWIIGTLQPETLPKTQTDSAEANANVKVPKGISMGTARELLTTGTDVTRKLTIERTGQNALLTLEVRTAKTASPSAAFQWEADGIGHLTIRRFNLLASDFIEKTLTQHRSELRGLIVDLRQCCGGVQTDVTSPEANGVLALTQILSLLTDSGTAALLEIKSHKQPLKIERNKHKPDYPLVVLMDRGTANLAETAAAALRDLGKAKLIGTPTYGDAILLYCAELKSGMALEIASARLLTASGKPLDKGVVPDLTASPENAREQALKTLANARKFTP